MKTYTLTFFLLTNTLFCYSQIGKIDSSEMKVLRIDPSQSIGKPVSEVYDRVRYVPLETNKESTFGEITRLKVWGDRLIIFDLDTWGVYIFDKEGKYINKISEKQIARLANLRVHNSGNIFNSFNLTRYNGKDVIDIRTTAPKSILRFSADGEYIGNFGDGIVAYGVTLSDGTRILPGYPGEGQTYYEFAVIKQTGDTTLYFPFDIAKYYDDDLISGERLTLGKDFQNALYTNYHSYDIFEINHTDVLYKYKVVLPGEISLPQDFMTNTKYRQKRWPYLVDNKNVVYGISNMYSIGDYLYLKLDAASQLKSSRKNIAYHLKNNIPISLQDLTPDSLSYFLPVEDSSCGSNFMSRGFLDFDGKDLYTSMSPICLEQFMQQNEENKVAYPKALTDLLGTKFQYLNPILVVLTPKTN